MKIGLETNPLVYAGKKTETELQIEGANQGDINKLRQLGKVECETCKNRRYVDESNDPGVSFKTPTKMNPQQAASGVISHEREHYSREGANAERVNREVLSNDIRLFTSVCPECGKTYVSGGETTTVTRKKKENEHFANRDFNNKIGAFLPKQVDEKI